MNWRNRRFQMFLTVIVYYMMIFPNTSGWVRGISCLMVGVGMLLFGIASIIRILPFRYN